MRCWLKVDGTYVHMQDAYVVDQQKVGSFAEIGYEKPTSSVITYDETTYTWHAKASKALDKCANNGEWGINAALQGSGAKYTIGADCPTLTPNFQYIGSSAAGS